MQIIMFSEVFGTVLTDAVEMRQAARYQDKTQYIFMYNDKTKLENEKGHNDREDEFDCLCTWIIGC